MRQRVLAESLELLKSQDSNPGSGGEASGSSRPSWEEFQSLKRLCRELQAKNRDLETRMGVLEAQIGGRVGAAVPLDVLGLSAGGAGPSGSGLGAGAGPVRATPAMGFTSSNAALLAVLGGGPGAPSGSSGMTVLAGYGHGASGGGAAASDRSLSAAAAAAAAGSSSMWERIASGGGSAAGGVGGERGSGGGGAGERAGSGGGAGPAERAGVGGSGRPPLGSSGGGGHSAVAASGSAFTNYAGRGAMGGGGKGSAPPSHRTSPAPSGTDGAVGSLHHPPGLREASPGAFQLSLDYNAGLGAMLGPLAGLPGASPLGPLFTIPNLMLGAGQPVSLPQQQQQAVQLQIQQILQQQQQQQQQTLQHQQQQLALMHQLDVSSGHRKRRSSDGARGSDALGSSGGVGGGADGPCEVGSRDER
jgi:hypothetical protein